jgi:hypothetical protein
MGYGKASSGSTAFRCHHTLCRFRSIDRSCAGLSTKAEWLLGYPGTYSRAIIFLMSGAVETLCSIMTREENDRCLAAAVEVKGNYFYMYPSNFLNARQT